MKKITNPITGNTLYLDDLGRPYSFINKVFVKETKSKGIEFLSVVTNAVKRFIVSTREKSIVSFTALFHVVRQNTICKRNEARVEGKNANFVVNHQHIAELHLTVENGLPFLWETPVNTTDTQLWSGSEQERKSLTASMLQILRDKKALRNKPAGQGIQEITSWQFSQNAYLVADPLADTETGLGDVVSQEHEESLMEMLELADTMLLGESNQIKSPLVNFL